MPWGFECRSKLLKQNPPNFTTYKRKNFALPGPTKYDVPDIIGGNGYSKIKRAPAYTFGYNTPLINKPAVTKKAPMISLCNTTNKGKDHIPGGIVTPHIEPVSSKMRNPGPGTYVPGYNSKVKRPPAYSIKPPAKPPYQPYDQWTPSSNMYCPPIKGKKVPAYTFGNYVKSFKPSMIPDPGAYEPNWNVNRPRRPAYSLGDPFRQSRYKLGGPAPNAYCHLKYKYVQPTVPAPTLGIRHSRYIGKRAEYIKSSKLDLVGKSM